MGQQRDKMGQSKDFWDKFVPQILTKCTKFCTKLRTKFELREEIKQHVNYLLVVFVPICPNVSHGLHAQMSILGHGTTFYLL